MRKTIKWLIRPKFTDSKNKNNTTRLEIELSGLNLFNKVNFGILSEENRSKLKQFVKRKETNKPYFKVYFIRKSYVVSLPKERTKKRRPCIFSIFSVSR